MLIQVKIALVLPDNVDYSRRLIYIITYACIS